MKWLITTALVVTAVMATPAYGSSILIDISSASHTANATAFVTCPDCTPITSGGTATAPHPVQTVADAFPFYSFANADVFEVSAASRVPLGYPNLNGDADNFAESVVGFSPRINAIAPLTFTLYLYDDWGYSDGAGVFATADVSLFDATVNRELFLGWPSKDWSYEDDAHTPRQGRPVEAKATYPTFLSAGHEYRLVLRARSWSDDSYSAASVKVSGLHAVPDTGTSLVYLSIGLGIIVLVARKIKDAEAEASRL